MRINYEELEYDGIELLEIHNGIPFTGTAVETSDKGAIISESQFVNGVRDGKERSWYLSGTLREESDLKNDVISGEGRIWNENGQLLSWTRAEYGIVLEQKKWNDSGALIEEFQLTANDDLWEVWKTSELRHNRETEREEDD